MSKLTSLGGVSLTNKPDPRAWNVATLSFTGNTLNYANLLQNSVVTSIDQNYIYASNASLTTGFNSSTPTGIALCPNGTTLYISQQTSVGAGYLQKYTMIKKWGIRSVVGGVGAAQGGQSDYLQYVSNTNLTNQDAGTQGIRFSSNGKFFYVLSTLSDSIRQYICPSPFEPMTATYFGNSVAFTSYGTTFTGLDFSSNGLKMFLSESSGHKIIEAYLTEAWNVQTAAYRTEKVIGPTVILGGVANPASLKFRKDGSAFFVTNNNGPSLFQFQTTELWNIETTVVPAQASSNTYFYHNNMTDIDIDPSGRFLYITDSGYDRINKFSFVKNQGFDVRDGPRGVGTAGSTQALTFKPDGTKFYYLEQGTFDRVFEFNMDDPWNIDTAYYNQNFKNANSVPSVSAQDIYFKPDGTKYYVVGGSRRIDEWNMSESWNVATSSRGANANIDLNAPGTGKSLSPLKITFKPDGTKFYILDIASGVFSASGKIQEYNLSTPWDISSFTFAANGPNVNFLATASDTQAYTRHFFWNTNGKQLYTYNRLYDNFTVFNFSQSWNVLTFTTYSNNVFDIADLVDNGSSDQFNGIYVRLDGKVFYHLSRSPHYLKKFRFLGYDVPYDDPTNL